MSHGFNKGFNSIPCAVNPPKSMGRQKNNSWNSYKECRSIHGRNNDLSIAD